jgi:hypothetical protein
MKKYLVVIFISFFIWSCGGSGGDDPTPPTPTENKAPSAPSLTEPTNNLLCIDNNVSFKWTASTDPEGDVITYKIELSKNSQFSPITNTITNSSTATAFTLEKGVAYYWRVKATDSKNASSSYSSTFQFYTEGEGTINHLPFAPELIKPALNLVIQETETVLEWNATDVDTDDTLTYDVYFDTINPPTTKVSDENYTSKTYTASLNPSTTYYWKVDVKDSNGGVTKGQVWTFKTD